MPSTKNHITTPIANHLEEHYEAHRIPETWGSPSVSQSFFDVWREDGPIAAGKYLWERQKNLGNPSLPRVAKVGALVTGIAMVTIADRRIGHRNLQNGRPEQRSFPKNAALSIGMYAIGAALLVAENGGGNGGGRISDDILNEVGGEEYEWTGQGYHYKTADDAEEGSDSDLPDTPWPDSDVPDTPWPDDY